MKINLVLIMVMLQLSETIDINRHTDIVLIGAQGDLSKKYLWNSIFKLYLKYSSSNSTFRIFGCGRSQPKESQKTTKEILQDIIK